MAARQNIKVMIKIKKACGFIMEKKVILSGT